MKSPIHFKSPVLFYALLLFLSILAGPILHAQDIGLGAVVGQELEEDILGADLYAETNPKEDNLWDCLLYTSDAADDWLVV